MNRSDRLWQAVVECIALATALLGVCGVLIAIAVLVRGL